MGLHGYQWVWSRGEFVPNGSRMSELYTCIHIYFAGIDTFHEYERPLKGMLVSHHFP